MATLKATVKTKRKDGTYVVYIRFACIFRIISGAGS